MAFSQPAAASADRIQVAYIKEDEAFGSFRDGEAGGYQELRLTSESLGQNTTAVASQEIRSDRQNVDVIRTGVNAGGDINFELSHGTYDEFFQLALQAAAVAGSVRVIDAADTTVSATAATNTFTHATGWALDPTANNVWVKVAGFVTAANNGYFKVASFTSTTIVVLQTGVIGDESVGPAVTIEEGAQIINGTTFLALSIQKQFTDLATEYERLTSMGVNTFSLNVPVDGVVTGTFGMIGKSAASSQSAADSAVVAATTTEVMAAVEDVSKIFEGNAAYGSTAWTMNLNNNLRPRLEIATLGAVGVGSGTIDLTGTLQAYFATPAAMDKYLAFTSSNIAMAMQDSAGNAYVFDIPEVKFTDGKRIAGGRNTDIMADLTWEAKRDPVELNTIKIVKW